MKECLLSNRKTPELDKQWQEAASFPTVFSFTIKLKGRDMAHRASGIVEDLPELSRAQREPLPPHGCLHLEKV